MKDVPAEYNSDSRAYVCIGIQEYERERERETKVERESREKGMWKGEWGMKGDRCRCYLPVGNRERGRELGQGKTTLNPHCQPRGAISAIQDPKCGRR